MSLACVRVSAAKQHLMAVGDAAGTLHILAIPWSLRQPTPNEVCYILSYSLTKVVEKIFEHRIRQQIEIDDMQFAFMKGKGTTDAIFMARQMQENFRVKGKKLCFGFVDLEKAFDRMPRGVISWAVRKLGVEEWLERQ